MERVRDSILGLALWMTLKRRSKGGDDQIREISSPNPKHGHLPTWKSEAMSVDIPGNSRTSDARDDSAEMETQPLPGPSQLINQASVERYETSGGNEPAVSSAPLTSTSSDSEIDDRPTTPLRAMKYSWLAKKLNHLMKEAKNLQKSSEGELEIYISAKLTRQKSKRHPDGEKFVQGEKDPNAEPSPLYTEEMVRTITREEIEALQLQTGQILCPTNASDSEGVSSSVEILSKERPLCVVKPTIRDTGPEVESAEEHEWDVDFWVPLWRNEQEEEDDDDW